MSLRVLLVEDDPELRATLREVMRVEGYEVASAASLADAAIQFSHAQAAGQELRAFDLVVLDLGLPDGEGSDFLATVRRQSACPVLIVSARHDDGQKIALLDAGADDYLVKPFSAGELLARMRVALRHRGRRVESALTRFSGHGVEVDLARRAVARDGQPVHLTPNEFGLLAVLVRNAGRVVTHRQLLSEVWGPEHTADTHYLRLYMAQLRAKLEAEPADPQLLLTETGVGYRLAEER
ncbi:MAG: winged helix-turn-helix domain-containing protein [Comamonas sp.]